MFAFAAGAERCTSGSKQKHCVVESEEERESIRLASQRMKIRNDSMTAQLRRERYVFEQRLRLGLRHVQDDEGDKTQEDNGHTLVRLGKKTTEMELSCLSMGPEHPIAFRSHALDLCNERSSCGVTFEVPDSLKMPAALLEVSECLAL